MPTTLHRDEARDVHRIVAWNIRAGGGRRVDHIAEQLRSWQPDTVALSEFRATPASLRLAEALAETGLTHQLTTADPALPTLNALLVASRWPLSLAPFRRLPVPRHRCLPAVVQAPQPFLLVAVHGPLGVTGLRRPFNLRLLALVKRWKHGPGLVVGDTNTGRPGADEEAPVFDKRDAAWMDAMEKAGWADAFRHLYGDRRVYTWYSPNRGNGFRLDQAFVNRSLLPGVVDVRYEWGRNSAQDGRRDALSDHAALILEVRATDGPGDQQTAPRGSDGTTQS